MSEGSASNPEQNAAPAHEPASELNSALSSSVQVVSGNPTPEDLAAIMAVLEAMAHEFEGTRARAAARAASAWILSQRPIRTPILPGITRWRTFS